MPGDATPDDPLLFDDLLIIPVMEAGPIGEMAAASSLRSPGVIKVQSADNLICPLQEARRVTHGLKC